MNKKKFENKRYFIIKNDLLTCFIIYFLQGHSHGIYPLIFLPGGLEPDTGKISDFESPEMTNLIDDWV